MTTHLPVLCPTVRALAQPWRPCTRDSRYEVSWHGQVRNATTGRVLKPSGTRVRDGVTHYAKVCLGRAQQVMVHILVAEAWHGPKPHGMPQVVDHIDNDGTRNCATNLRWLSYSMNTRQWYAVQARFQAAGEAYGWDLGPAVEEDEWAATAARLSEQGF